MEPCRGSVRGAMPGLPVALCRGLPVERAGERVPWSAGRERDRLPGAPGPGRGAARPGRIEILRQLAAPASCTDVAGQLGQAPQKVYYHVKRMEQAGLVDRVAQRQVRGITEGIYQASGGSYWLAPDLVGAIGERRAAGRDEPGLPAEPVRADAVGPGPARRGNGGAAVPGHVRRGAAAAGAPPEFLADLRAASRASWPGTARPRGSAHNVPHRHSPVTQGGLTMTTQTYTLRASIGAPPEAVYAALTDSAALRAWLAEHAEVALDQGIYEFWGRFTPEGERGRQRPLAFEPGRRLSFSWRLEGAETEVAVTLDGQDGGTVLRLTHSGAPPRARATVTGCATCSCCRWPTWPATARAVASARGATSPRSARRGAGSVEIDATAGEVFASLIEPAQLDRWIARARAGRAAGGRALQLRLGPRPGADPRTGARQGAGLLLAA